MGRDDIEHSANGHERRVIVDEREIRVSEAAVTGRIILKAAGRLPPDDFIVYLLGKDNVLEDIGLDRTVHIDERGVERFFTFESDRSFRFEIDGKREDWGYPKITEETIRKLAGADEGFRVWLVRMGEPDRLIGRGESVDLTAPGIERFYLERILTVEVVNEENGSEFWLQTSKDTKLKTIIAEMYDHLHVPRRGDDRLRCEESGEDVFGFARLSLGQYLEAGHCRCLVWCFVGGTGGAMCR